jgi:DHA1 family bicyclomycin/chloramphenicol resistance-like MFS transporter
VSGEAAPTYAEPGAEPDAGAPSLWVLAVLSLLLGFAAISTDLYLPALPAIGAALQAKQGTIALTVSGYLVGFSLGQLVWGPLGDQHGRKVPIGVGLVLFVIASIGCALCTTAWQMIAWRVLQAVGACAGVVLARAMVRDMYAGAQAARMLSTLMTVMAVAPLLGPLAGGQILVHGSWRGIFWLLVGIGVVAFAALFTLPETLHPHRRNTEPLGRALANYASLLGDRRLLGYAGAGGFLYGGIYAYIAGTPFAYITYHHVAPQRYGLLFGAGILGLMATNMINARTVMRLGGDRLMRIGGGVTLAAGAVLVADACLGWGGLAGLVAPLLAFIAMTGFIAANSLTGALNNFPERAGAVSALVGSIHYGSGILSSALVGILADGTPRPMAIIIGACGLGVFLCAWLLATRGEDRRGA